jgi:glutamate-1-semialdehyde 2,1-aminomutase
VALEALIAAEPESVAAVIIEPVLHNTVAIRATDSFLRSLRTLTAKQGIVLIFDEVITGFRHHLGGYQAICGVTPDLSTFGKALGNGFPIAGLCGERTLMARFGSACKPQVNLGGTFNAAPAGVAAAIATMTLMGSAERYARLFELGERLTAGLRKAIAATQIPAQVISYGSIVGVHFTGATSIHCYEDVASSDRALDEAFRRGLLARGILVSTQPFRRFHLTLAHDEASIDRIVDAARATLAAMGDRSTER